MEEVKVPGFGLPLDELPTWQRKGDKHRFPHAIADFFATEGVTLREQRMLDFINQVTDKHRWTEKVYDEAILQNWREEACGTPEQQETSSKHLSLECFDYCVKELQDKANYFREHGSIHVLDTDASIVKTDFADGDNLGEMLCQYVRPLEAVPDARKDWHPGSNGLVLDLVHPSLFPLEYGVSRVLSEDQVRFLDCSKDIGRGQQCPIPDAVAYDQEFNRYWSRFGNLKPWGSHQWLPSDVKFHEGGSPSIVSYVNNLHPRQHSELYRVLEKAVDKALPLWNECLSWFHNRIRIKVNGGCGYDDYKPPPTAALRQYHLDNGGAEDDDVEDNEGLLQEWISEHPDARELLQPDPDEVYIPFEESIAKQQLPRLDLRAKFPAGIQVIFKLANIHLTPSKPRYNGSDWHVEGALNDHICATALFYYDQENIEDSYLEFRQRIDSEAVEMKPGQDEYVACEDLYGIKNEGSAIQDLGKVLTRKSRVLAFPNVMQHRIRPFGLKDPTKPGFRKILALFLVDPHIRVLSTANVPPQQRDWWAEEVRKISPFADLPIELFDRVIENVEDFPIGWEEACAVREALMTERGRTREEMDNVLAEDTFFFCEH